MRDLETRAVEFQNVRCETDSHSEIASLCSYFYKSANDSLGTERLRYMRRKRKMKSNIALVKSCRGDCVCPFVSGSSRRGRSGCVVAPDVVVVEGAGVFQLSKWRRI